MQKHKMNHKPDFQQCGILTSVDSDEPVQLWNKISADTLCIQVCFCMLVISFYFVNCVIISCKLSFSSRFTRI